MRRAEAVEPIVLPPKQFEAILNDARQISAQLPDVTEEDRWKELLLREVDQAEIGQATEVVGDYPPEINPVDRFIQQMYVLLQARVGMEADPGELAIDTTLAQLMPKYIAALMHGKALDIIPQYNAGFPWTEEQLLVRNERVINLQ